VYLYIYTYIYTHTLVHTNSLMALWIAFWLCLFISFSSKASYGGSGYKQIAHCFLLHCPKSAFTKPRNKKHYYMETIVIIRYENSYIVSLSVTTRV